MQLPILESFLFFDTHFDTGPLHQRSQFQFAEREATTMEEHAIELEKRMKDQAEKVEADQ